MKQSVIIPLRNGATFIEQTLTSVAGAPCVEELIVIDDGSSDDSVERVNAWAANHARPLILDIFTPSGEPAKGPSAARNRGAALATCPWLWFVDGDDLTTITSEDPRSTPPPATNVVYSRLQRFALWPDGERRSEPERFPHVSARLVQRDYFLAMGGFNEELRYGEDLDFFQRLLERRAAMFEIDDVVMLFRQHAGSYTGQRPEALRSGLFAALRAASLRAREQQKGDER